MKKKYTLKGLDCPNCAQKIEKELTKINGVKSASVDYLKLRLTIEVEESNSSNILKKVKETILALEPDIIIEDEIKQEYLNQNITSFLISLFFFLLALFLPQKLKTIKLILYILSYLIVGYEVVIKSLRNIFHKEFFDENFLMTIATVGAFLIGEYQEAVAVMLFYQLGEIFQKYAVNHSRKSISALMDLRTDYANVIRGNKTLQVNPAQVKVGENILINPGEKIPLDGLVISGTSYLDTLALTGESIPRKVQENDQVISGCINQTSPLKVKVTSPLEQSTVSKILELVENASSNKSTSEDFITKFAKYYTPVVVFLALALALLPPLIIPNTSFKVWLYRALSFLVVSCPCALVISIPLSFFGGIGAAAKKGILLKGSNTLENLSNIDTLIFDKTGTLTKGIFEVQTIHSEKISKEELIKLASHAEYYSNHPIANSLKKYYGKPLNKDIIQDVQEISGLGITATIDGKKILLGNNNLLKKNKIKVTTPPEIGTILYIAIDSTYAGYIIIADSLKPDSKATIASLKQKGLAQVGMLSGDKQTIADSVAKNLNLDFAYAELLPDQKVTKMQEILATCPANKKVAFVGDGMNDAPVIALADIGIAMGGLGSDAAVEAADMVIMNDELTKIIEAINLSNETLKIVKQNIIFAITIKILVLFLSALGLTTMWASVFADVGVSVLAILNALRLLKK